MGPPPGTPPLPLLRKGAVNLVALQPNGPPPAAPNIRKAPPTARPASSSRRRGQGSALPMLTACIPSDAPHTARPVSAGAQLRRGSTLRGSLLQSQAEPPPSPAFPELRLTLSPAGGAQEPPLFMVQGTRTPGSMPPDSLQPLPTNTPGSSPAPDAVQLAAMDIDALSMLRSPVRRSSSSGRAAMQAFVSASTAMLAAASQPAPPASDKAQYLAKKAASLAAQVEQERKAKRALAQELAELRAAADAAAAAHAGEVLALRKELGHLKAVAAGILLQGDAARARHQVHVGAQTLGRVCFERGVQSDAAACPRPPPRVDTAAQTNGRGSGRLALARQGLAALTSAQLEAIATQATGPSQPLFVLCTALLLGLGTRAERLAGAFGAGAISSTLAAAREAEPSDISKATLAAVSAMATEAGGILNDAVRGGHVGGVLLAFWCEAMLQAASGLPA